MNVLLRSTIAFAGGILLQSFLPNHWDTNNNEWVIIGCVGLLFVTIFLLVIFRRGNRYWLGALTMLLFIGLGCIRTPDIASVPDLSQVEAYEASVLSPPETRSKTYKVEVELQRAKWDNAWHPIHGKLLLYVDKMATKPRYGEILLIRGQPRPVEPPMNPAQFDYRKFLSYKRIHHQQYLKATDYAITDDYQGIWYKKWAFAVSEWSDAALRRLVPFDREYAVAKAMVLGLRDEMDNELVQSYSAAGAVHVLSVSGFHIAIFIWLLNYILSGLEKRRYGRWLSLGVTLIILWFYAVLTGLSAPVIRSAVMFTIFLLANPLNRIKNGETALFGSALILLAIDPLQLYSVSFQLSYAALGGIIFLQPSLYQSFTIKNWYGNKLWEITAVALAAQLVTFPIGVYYFYQFPTYFLLANPFVALLATAMLPVAMAAIAFSPIPFLGEGLGWVLTGITWLLNKIVILTNALPFATLGGLSMSALEVGLVYAVMATLLALLYYRQLRWLWSALTLSILLCALQLIEMNHYRKQKVFAIHAVSRQTAISFINANDAFLVADSAFFQAGQQPFDFYLKNFYVERNIRRIHRQALEQKTQPVVRQLPFGKLIVWQGKSLLLVDQIVRNAIPPVTDYVLIRNSAFRKTEQLLSAFGTQKLIFDNSNKFYVLETLQIEAQKLRLPWYFVNKKGAFLAFL